jgi:hypothetical protein
MNGRHSGVHIHIASDKSDADPSLIAEHWDGKMIVKIAAAHLVREVMNFEVG